MLNVIIILVNVGFAFFVLKLVGDGFGFLAASFSIVLVVFDIAFLFKRNYPYRWFFPAFAFTFLLAVYPFIYNIYISFTNYSQQHILTKQQAIKRIEMEQFLPKDAVKYNWTAYYSQEQNEYCLLLRPDDGVANTIFACSNEIIDLSEELSDQIQAPNLIAGYSQLSKAEVVQQSAVIGDLTFGDETNRVQILSLREAGAYKQRYTYQLDNDTMLDCKDGISYFAKEGYFTSKDGMILKPGFKVEIGFMNYARLFRAESLKGPLLSMFIWNVLFATLKVIAPFFVGLLVAIVLNNLFPIFKRIIRSSILLPYIIPAFISILIWRGLLNPHLGLVNQMLDFLLGWHPSWFTEPFWTKVALVIISLWLSFPYWVLICTGALQAIPDEVNQAAVVDGASSTQIFYYITLPYILTMMSPLLVFSFANSFNSFNLIYLFNKGGPPMSGSVIPVGHTDILLSYSYRMSFDMGGGDYAYAASITFIIFLILTPVILGQWNYIMKKEEVLS